MTVRYYLILLAAVALGRVLELRHSRRNQRRLREAGSAKSPEPGYRWMVAFHAAVILGSALEVVLLHRPFYPQLALVCLGLFAFANALRWWAIATLGPRWNVEVMSVSRLGFVSSGPYRWVRHPNYTAVFVEMLALPLIHTAWIVALAGALVHILILKRRVALEESVLMKDPGYESAFASKPRFWRMN